MEQSDFDSITTRVRHLRENITELQKNYDQLTLNVKGIEPGKANYAYTSPSSKENDHQEIFQDKESGKANHANTNSSSKLEKTEHQTSKPDVSEQPSTSGVKDYVLKVEATIDLDNLALAVEPGPIGYDYFLNG
ncbi:hypothetical protein ACS0TY_032484 [Phlomoides rotata]